MQVRRVTDERGGIVNDPVLLRVEENRFWLAAADSDLLLWAKGVAVGSGLRRRDPRAGRLAGAGAGPEVERRAQALLGPWVLELPYYHCAETELDGIPLVVGRTGWTGEVGYELYLRDGSRGDELWERVLEAGAPFSIRPIPPCQARRIEAGIFNYGSDMTLDDNPFEVSGLERLVGLDKAGPFVGREALERIAREGVSRKLVGVELEGEPLTSWLTHYWPARHGGEHVGHVTDAIHSPRLDRNIGYVWVPIDLAEPGTSLEVETPDGTTAASVAALPFVDPRKETPKR